MPSRASRHSSNTLERNTRPRRCPQCFNKIPPQSAFCLHCGNKIPPPPRQVEPPPRRPAQAPTPQPTVIVKSSGLGRLLVRLILLALIGGVIALALGFRLEAQKDWLGRDKPIVEIKKDGGTINLPTVATPPPRRGPREVATYSTPPPDSTAYAPPTTTPNLPPDPAARPAARDLASGTMPVGALEYRYIQFTVEPSSYQAVVVGKFSATGGQNDIDVLILPQSDFARWQGLDGFRSYYNSGYVTGSRLKVPLPPGDYFLVFNNRRAVLTSKVVEAYVELRYE